MWVSCDEAIAGAKRRLRAFASAPDPRRHARALQAGLAAAEDWPAADREVIVALGAWLRDYPPSDALRDRCAAALAVLMSPHRCASRQGRGSLATVLGRPHAEAVSSQTARPRRVRGSAAAPARSQAAIAVARDRQTGTSRPARTT